MSTLAGAGLERSFGGVHAVAGVDVELEPGEVVAVVGPNGSGKSTLIDVLTGMVVADRGLISVNSHPLRRVTASAVARRGVRRTFQNGRLIETLSAIDNVRLGLHMDRGGGRLGWGRSTRARSAVALHHLEIDQLTDTVVSELSRGERRRVELARALVGHPAALILDEPTAGLPRPDAARLTGLLRTVAEAGVGVLMIEHDIDMVRSCADGVIVMVDGRICARGSPAILDDAAVRLVLGQAITAAARAAMTPAGPALLSAEGLWVRRGREDILRGVSIDLHAGEVVAMLGANGSGKTTLLAALSGLLAAQRGRTAFEGRDTTGWTAARLARSGVIHLPQNRHLFASMTVVDNLLVSDAAMEGGREPVPMAEIFERLPEIGRRRSVPVNRLSGGEQQLVTLARGLRTRPRVILADEPTAALAPGTRRRVLSWLRELADDGAAVLVAEQNAAEAMAIADRSTTMRGGAVELVGAEPEVVA
ncbi:MAG: ATP-binding cassette domain-containing protein [Candidatus Dormibacter sp.]